MFFKIYTQDAEEKEYMYQNVLTLQSSIRSQKKTENNFQKQNKNKKNVITIRDEVKFLDFQHGSTWIVRKILISLENNAINFLWH